MLFDTRRFHQSGNSCEPRGLWRKTERERDCSSVRWPRPEEDCESSKSVEGNREGRRNTGEEKRKKMGDERKLKEREREGESCTMEKKKKEERTEDSSEREREREDDGAEWESFVQGSEKETG